MGKLVLKGQSLFERSKLANTHQLSLRARISAQTAYKYFNSPEDVHAVDLEILTAILLDGLQMTPEEIMEMRLGDLFEIK